MHSLIVHRFPAVVFQFFLKTENSKLREGERRVQLLTLYRQFTHIYNM